MENMQWLIFAKELRSERLGPGLLKVYVVGLVFAVLGTIIGLIETICNPFSSCESMDTEMLLKSSWEQDRGRQEEEEEEEEEVEEVEEGLACENGGLFQGSSLTKTLRLSQRCTANRLHAS